MKLLTIIKFYKWKFVMYITIILNISFAYIFFLYWYIKNNYYQHHIYYCDGYVRNRGTII